MLDYLTTDIEKPTLDVNYGPYDVNQWVRLVYNFTGAPTEVYDEIGIRFNHGNTTTEFWYFDDVMGTTDAILGTGIGTKDKITEVIDVYLNPSKGHYSLDTKGVFPMGSTYDLVVIDAQGRSVLLQQVIDQGQLVTFDLCSQPNGIYVVRLSGHLLHYVKIIVKE